MRFVWQGIGWASVILGALGILVPLLPTTPFLLLAAWCFARSSQRFHDWLVHHPRLGPPITAWRSEGAISRVAASLPNLALALQAICLVAASVFILSRPKPYKSEAATFRMPDQWESEKIARQKGLAVRLGLSPISPAPVCGPAKSRPHVGFMLPRPDLTGARQSIPVRSTVGAHASSVTIARE